MWKRQMAGNFWLDTHVRERLPDQDFQKYTHFFSKREAGANQNLQETDVKIPKPSEQLSKQMYVCIYL